MARGSRHSAVGKATAIAAYAHQAARSTGFDRLVTVRRSLRGGLAARACDCEAMEGSLPSCRRSYGGSLREAFKPQPRKAVEGLP